MIGYIVSPKADEDISRSGSTFMKEPVLKLRTALKPRFIARSARWHRILDLATSARI